MRTRLLSSVASSLFILLCASEAGASEPQPDAEEKSFGTIPARSKEQMKQQLQKPSPVQGGSAGAPDSPYAVPPQSSPTATVQTSDDGFETKDERQPRTWGSGPEQRSSYAPIATDPPGDWAVLHAGLRPRIGTFGGIATLAVAHARTESFYGGFSLSFVRNDAGTHIGLAQIALGRNLSDSFGGGLQLSISENRARSFVGIGQTALAYNRALSMTAITQVAAYNRTRDLDTIAQIGGYNRTDESFAGAVQLGGFNHSRGDFSGIVQLGAVSATGRELFGDKNSSNNRNGEHYRFAGIAQMGVVSTVHGNFYGIAQIGAASFTSDDFRGIVQFGALGAGAKSFKGLAQVGLVTMSSDSLGLQIGAGAISLKEHSGIQIGALGTYAKSIDGAQIGVANVANKVRGVQIGVFNYARSLRGVQIGLANHAEDGVLPWTALLNMGFGDDPGERLDYDYEQRQKSGGAKSTSTRF